MLRFEPPRVVSVTHWSPLTGDPDAPENIHHVTYELSPRDAGGTRLTLVHGNSPSERGRPSDDRERLAPDAGVPQRGSPKTRRTSGLRAEYSPAAEGIRRRAAGTTRGRYWSMWR